MVGGDPGWTQQSHHVQTQRQEDAQQGDDLERSEHVHLVHGHLHARLTEPQVGQMVEARPSVRPSSTLPPHTAPQPAALLCARTSWESLAAHFRLERIFKTRDSFIRFDIRNVPDVPFSQRTHSSLTLCYFILSILNLST